MLAWVMVQRRKVADSSHILEEELVGMRVERKDERETKIRMKPRSLPTCNHQKELLEKLWRKRENFVFSIFFFQDENKLPLDQKVTVPGLQGKMFPGAASLEDIGSAPKNRTGLAILLLRIYPPYPSLCIHKFKYKDIPCCLICEKLVLP